MEAQRSRVLWVTVPQMHRASQTFPKPQKVRKLQLARPPQEIARHLRKKKAPPKAFKLQIARQQDPTPRLLKLKAPLRRQLAHPQRLVLILSNRPSMWCQSRPRLLPRCQPALPRPLSLVYPAPAKADSQAANPTYLAKADNQAVSLLYLAKADSQAANPMYLAKADNQAVSLLYLARSDSLAPVHHSLPTMALALPVLRILRVRVQVQAKGQGLQAKPWLRLRVQRAGSVEERLAPLP